MNGTRGSGSNCLRIGPARDNQVLKGLEFEEADSVENADFILVTGPQDLMSTAEPYDDMLAVARERDLPMVCANPDLEVIRGGVRQICAGAIAARYEAQGGDVRWHGKPGVLSVYEPCFEMLGIADKAGYSGSAIPLRDRYQGCECRRPRRASGCPRHSQRRPGRRRRHPRWRSHRLQCGGRGCHRHRRHERICLVSDAREITGLAEVADAYDTYLVDQWGVLHDGHTAHTPAVDVMHRLKEAGKIVDHLVELIAPSGNDPTEYGRMGIDHRLFDVIATSGEEVWQAISHRQDDFYRELGRRCVVFQWGKDDSFFEALDLEPVDDIEAAEFILLNGTEKDKFPSYEPILRARRRTRIADGLRERRFRQHHARRRTRAMPRCAGPSMKRLAALFGGTESQRPAPTTLRSMPARTARGSSQSATPSTTI